MALKDDLKIDLLDLAEEASKQPGKYYEWAEKYAKAHAYKVKIREGARLKRIQLKQAYDLKRAEIEMLVREEWTNYSSEKRTEGGVANFVASHPMLVKANKKYMDGLAELDAELTTAIENDLLMEAARDAMAQRKNSIQVAAELYLGGYFSEVKPKQPKEVESGALERVRGMKKRNV